MVAELGGRKPVYRCQDCGDCAALPHLASMETSLLLMKSKMFGYDQLLPVLTTFQWPVGPLHSKHRLVLNSQFGAGLKVSLDIFKGDFPTGERTRRDT